MTQDSYMSYKESLYVFFPTYQREPFCMDYNIFHVYSDLHAALHYAH